MRIDLKLGYTCNNNCMFCINPMSERKMNKTFQEIKKELDDYIKSDIDVFNITGGEPFIRQDITM